MVDAGSFRAIEDWPCGNDKLAMCNLRQEIPAKKGINTLTLKLEGRKLCTLSRSQSKIAYLMEEVECYFYRWWWDFAVGPLSQLSSLRSESSSRFEWTLDESPIKFPSKLGSGSRAVSFVSLVERIWWYRVELVGLRIILYFPSHKLFFFKYLVKDFSKIFYKKFEFEFDLDYVIFLKFKILCYIWKCMFIFCYYKCLIFLIAWEFA